MLVYINSIKYLFYLNSKPLAILNGALTLDIKIYQFLSKFSVKKHMGNHIIGTLKIISFKL